MHDIGAGFFRSAFNYSPFAPRHLFLIDPA